MGQNKFLDEDVFHVAAVQVGSAQGPVPKPGEPLEPESEPKPDPKAELEATLNPPKAEVKPWLPIGRSKVEDDKPRGKK